jgi:voltage-gated potassium channel
MILRRCGISTLNSIFYLRRQTYKLFHGKSIASRYIELFLSLCIICNVICFLLQEEITFVHYWEGFQITQIVTTGIFALEWFLRFWSIVEKPKFKRLGGFKGRLRWSVSIESILDLLSFVPFFAFYGDPQNDDGSPYSWLRALRVLTILKAGRHAAAYQVIGTIIIANKDILLASMWVSTVAFLFVAFMLYETMEGENNSLFESIPAAM